jgi:hypothetical protein
MKRKNEQMGMYQTKEFLHSKRNSYWIKDNAHNGRKYLPATHPISNYIPKSTRNSIKPTPKESTSSEEMGT